MSSARALARLVLLVGFEVAALVALHRLGAQPWLQVEPDLRTWLAVASAEDAVVVALRYVALGAAWWLALTTGLYVVARLVRLPAAVRAVSWATLPAVRRVADRAVAVTIASSVVAGAPAAALALPAPVVAEVAVAPGLDDPRALPPLEAPGLAPDAAPPPDRRDGAADLTVPAAPPPAVLPAAAKPAPAPTDAVSPARAEPSSPPADPSSETAPGPAPAADPGSGTHVVAPGEHLWGIAAARVAGQRPDGPAPGDAEVAVYWRRLVAANVGRLRSGDPDLVFPGERVVLPPLDDPR